MSTTAGHRIFALPFASVYPLYVSKVEKKGRTKDELDAVISWLTGYDDSAVGTPHCRRYDPRRLLRRGANQPPMQGLSRA